MPVGPSVPEPEPGAPTLSVAAVAKRLGVAPSTLRTWDRRYGVGPSEHTGGRHRRYDATDVGRLELMQRALLGGSSTAEAARYALELMPKSGPLIDLPVQAGRAGATQPHGDPWRPARELSGAALAMDGVAVDRLLDEVLADLGVERAWREVIAPVLTAFGVGWRGAVPASEVDHLLAERVFTALIRATPVLVSPRNERPVFLGRVPGGYDGIALYALAAALALRGIGTQVFGTAVPAETLAVAVRRSAPSAVVLWAERDAVANPTVFDRVARGNGHHRLFACGRGWDLGGLPRRVELLDDVPLAVDRIEHVLLGGPTERV